MAPKKPIENVAFPLVVESSIDKNLGPEALYAALDLGTNSCRMLIAQPKGAQFHVIDSFATVSYTHLTLPTILLV